MGRSKSGNGSAMAPVPAVGDIAIYLCRDPVDFRMGINGLSVMVEARLRYDPFSRILFASSTSVAPRSIKQSVEGRWPRRADQIADVGEKGRAS